MTTSGSVDFSVSRDNILTDALIIAQAVGPDDSVPANWTTHAARQLNKIVKAFGSRRIGLWARKTGYILPVSDTNSVALGPSGGHATLSYTQTTLGDDHDAAETSITLTSATGFADTQAVGIELEDGTMFWTTQSGAAVGNVITIADALPDEAVEGGYVYTYATKLQRPLRIVAAYRSDLADSSDTPIDIEGRQYFEDQNNKSTEGEVTLLSYEPQLDNGIAYFWPRMSDGKSVIKILFQRPFEDFDASGDTPDFPQEAYDMLTLQLAVRLAPVYGMPVSDRAQLLKEADMALGLFLENEPEEGSFRIQPEIER